MKVMNALSQEPLSAHGLATALGMRSKTGALKRTLGQMMSESLIEYTMPCHERLRPGGHAGRKAAPVERDRTLVIPQGGVSGF